MSQAAPLPRSEPVRPQFFRPDWRCLNGPWQFHADPLGQMSDLREALGLDRTISVPFAPESRLSGIGETGFMESVWYRRTIDVPRTWQGKRVLLHFGAVDWRARVFIDGALIGEHSGGSTAFAFDITEAVRPGGTHNLVVHAVDELRSGRQPGGKQSTEPGSWGCFYTRTTGIWQPVWLEAAGAAYLTDIRITPDLAGGQIFLTPSVAGWRSGCTIRVEAGLAGKPAGAAATALQPGVPLALALTDVQPWSPASPTLYDLSIVICGPDGAVLDRVESYAGLRSVAIDGDRILLNGAPLYHRFVLDQGFYPDGIWTAPDDAALKRDIELSQALGFNGARLHQKVFEPRFHYWADRLGYLTWAESPSWGLDIDSADAAGNFLAEWAAIVRQVGNHPSVIAWTPLNETGHRAGRDDQPISEPHRRLIERAAALTRLLDPTRPVNDASGWVHRDTDIWTSHSYEQDPALLREILAPYPHVFRNAPANEPPYDGQPYILDEFGGAAFDSTAVANRALGARTAETPRDPKSLSQAWGYGEPPRSATEFEERLAAQVDVVLSTAHVRGYCYTQLTDVEQEQNGVLDDQRRPKLPIETYRAIFSKEPAAT